MLNDAQLDALKRAQAQVNQLVLGKPHEVRLAFVALLSDGHVLIEDLPGLGKTTLAHALAATLGLAFQRIQFTSDLLPADVLGVAVYNSERGKFEFHPGPIFAQVVLADEVNRATPKAQSALLEAMEEHQVTIEGDEVVSCDIARDEADILIVTDAGYGKRTKVERFNRQARGGQGVRGIKLTAKRGRVVAAFMAGLDDELLLISTSGVVIRTAVREIASQGRDATGVRVMNLGPGDAVAAVAPVAGESEGHS